MNVRTLVAAACLAALALSRPSAAQPAGGAPDGGAVTAAAPAADIREVRSLREAREARATPMSGVGGADRGGEAAGSMVAAAPYAHQKTPPGAQATALADPGTALGPARLPLAATLRSPRAPAAEPGEWSPEVYGRYVTVPDAIVASLFSARTPMHSYAVGAGVRWRWYPAGEWRFSVDWLRMGFTDGNWLETSQPAASASFLEWDLGFLSVAATHLWRFELWGDRLDLVLGAGAALGVFIGDVYATDVVPTCTAPVSQCVPWRRVTRRTLSLPTRVLGLPIATVGLDWRVVSRLSLRVEGGLYGVPYAGGALAWGL